MFQTCAFALLIAGLLLFGCVGNASDYSRVGTRAGESAMNASVEAAFSNETNQTANATATPTSEPTATPESTTPTPELTATPEPTATPTALTTPNPEEEAAVAGSGTTREMIRATLPPGEVVTNVIITPLPILPPAPNLAEACREWGADYTVGQTYYAGNGYCLVLTGHQGRENYFGFNTSEIGVEYYVDWKKFKELRDVAPGVSLSQAWLNIVSNETAGTSVDLSCFSPLLNVSRQIYYNSNLTALTRPLPPSYYGSSIMLDNLELYVINGNTSVYDVRQPCVIWLGNGSNETTVNFTVVARTNFSYWV